jgi:hypothetical protein
VADTLVVADAERLRLVLETFSRLDDIRWQDAGNYNPLNYSHDDLTPDEKLLTHWLCYIADRQTAFRRVWDVGAYVISDLVRRYTREPQTDVRSLLYRYLPDRKAGLRLACDLHRADERLRRYRIEKSPVEFSSRYMPEDLVLMYRTLRVLDAVGGRSLSRYIAASISESGDRRGCIRSIASALDDLTYSAGGTVSATEFESALERVDGEAARFSRRPDVDRPLLGRKRLWCSLRDYLKSPDFNAQFAAGLTSAGIPDPETWDRRHPTLVAALVALELPGDVWNNAPIFRQGLFNPYVRRVPRTWDMPRTIRRIYELLIRDRPLRFYPEQLDVTFDFVLLCCKPLMGYWRWKDWESRG